MLPGLSWKLSLVAPDLCTTRITTEGTVYVKHAKRIVVLALCCTALGRASTQCTVYVERLCGSTGETGGVVNDPPICGS